MPQTASKPLPVVPPKPVSSISLEEPRIDDELNELCGQLSPKELNQLVSNKDALAEKYFDLSSVQDRKNKLHEYIQFIQKRATEVVELKESLKIDAATYDSLLDTYKGIQKSIDEIKNEVDKKSGGNEVDAVLRKKRDKLDSDIQKMSAEFRKAGTKSEEDVNEFINQYYDSMKDYNKCSILLTSLSNY